MALFLSSKLRKAADTSLIEGRKNELLNDHEEFIAFEQSEELQNYIELEREINSEDFKQNKKEIEAKSFKGSKLEKREKKLKYLLKSKRYRVYASVHEGSELSEFEKMKDSEELLKYMELQADVNSGKLTKKEFNEDWLLYKNLKKVPEICAYFKFKKSNKSKIYFEILESNLLQEIEDLKSKLSTEELISEENAEQSEGLHKFNELEKELKRILKSKRYKIYTNVIEGSDLLNYEKIEGSDDLVKYIELQADANSGKLNKEEINEDWLLYKKLKKSSEIKAYFKFKHSKKHDIYFEVLASSLLQEIEDLKEELASEEYTSEKNYLLDKKRFEKTEAFNRLITYKELSESESFKKYLQFQKKNDFHLVKEWELTFSENFEGSELDKEKWMTRYYWGDVLMNEDYALPTDAHIFSEKNIKISNSVARLETRKEKAQGKVWDSKIGFVQTDFDYTSALISTGKSFRQKYGLFEAKIKVSDIENVMHSFWMLSDTSLPHIDIAKTSPCGKLFPGNISGNEDKPKVNYAKISGLDWTNDFFIYSLEWAPNKLIWRVNDVEIYTQTENIPHEPMYLILSSGVINTDSDVNAVMEIDWVKCYQRA